MSTSSGSPEAMDAIAGNVAEALRQRGVAALVAKQVPDARRHLLGARELAEDPDTSARVNISLAYLAVETGDARGAQELIEQALAEAVLAETVGLAHCQAALIAMRQGDVRGALESFGVALERLTDPAGRAKAHINRGGVYLQQGATSAAAADFTAAAQVLEQLGMPIDAAMARHNIGYTQLLAGDLPQALSRMAEARPVLAPLSPTSRAICDQDRAEVLLAAGLVTEGRMALRAAAKTFAVQRLPQRRGEAELALARSLLISDPSESLAASRVARRLFVRAGNESWKVRAEAVAISAEVEMGRSGPSLIGRGEAIASELDHQGLIASASLVRLSVARVEIRRHALGDAAARLAGFRLNAGTPLAVRLAYRTARFEFAEAQGRPAKALGEVRAGLADLHAWQSSFGSLDLQTFVVGRGRRLASHALGLAVESGRPATVFEWSERARMLATRTRPVRPPGDEQLAADLTELRHLSAASESHDVDIARRVSQVRRRVRERAWQLPGSGKVRDRKSVV